MEPPKVTPLFLPLKVRLSPVPKRTHCKVNPDDVHFLFYQQFIEIFIVQVADIEQYRCVAQSLFNADATDIYRTPCKMVAQRGPTYCFIHFRTSETTIDDYWVIPFAIQIIPSLSQLLQLLAHSL